MKALGRVYGSAVLAFVLTLIAACDRNITVEEVSQQPAICFQCHSDQDLRLVSAEAQWLNSQHASGENIDRSYPPCAGCHVSEGFVERIQTGSAVTTWDNPTAIHCFTCHAPHTNSDFSLRVEAPQSLQDGFSFDIGAGNLCVSCHQSRRDVNTYVVAANDSVFFDSKFWGPHHSVQGDMLFGSNGYEYATWTYTQSPHRSVTADGCIDCHKKETRNYVLGGHSFNMHYDEAGTEILNTAACTPCHGSLSDFNFNGVQDDVNFLLSTLRGQLLTAGLIDSTDHVIPNQYTSSDSAGAVWNYLMVLEDRSEGVHNANYITGLLTSSFLFMSGAPGPQPSAEPAF